MALPQIVGEQSALLFAVVGVAVLALAGLHRRPHAAGARWRPAVLAAGVAARIAAGPDLRPDLLTGGP